VKLPISLPILLAAAFGLSGCAFVPQDYPRLDAAGKAHGEAQADSRLAGEAAAQLKQAGETLERARTARNTLDDPAVVDHLAYLAKQRVAIAREIASQEASRRAIAAATL
jgi:hypothetical protein